jgi:hypothetical protein
MPRSTSDSGGTLLRSVLGKSSLTLSSNGDDEVQTPKHTDSISKRASKLFSHSRSSSVQSTTAILPDAKNLLFKSRRQKSLSHLERLNPISTSRTTISPTNSFKSDHSRESPLSAQRSPDEFYGRVLHHGEAHISQVGWRKKSEYLVLTEHYLFRFKSVRKASDKFPWLFPIGAALRPTSTSNSGSSLSTLSINEVTTTPSAESPTEVSGIKSAIPLQQVIAVQVLQESRTRATLEVISYTATSSYVSCVTFFVERVNGQPHWLETLSSTARDSQSLKHGTIPTSHWESIRGMIGLEADTELSLSCMTFPVLRRPNTAGNLGYVMQDDLHKDSPILHYVVIGKHKTYVIPLSLSHKSGNTASSSNGKIGSFGTVCLKKITVSDRDDSFDLVFRFVISCVSRRLLLIGG